MQINWAIAGQVVLLNGVKFLTTGRDCEVIKYTPIEYLRQDWNTAKNIAINYKNLISGQDSSVILDSYLLSAEALVSKPEVETSIALPRPLDPNFGEGGKPDWWLIEEWGEPGVTEWACYVNDGNTVGYQLKSFKYLVRPALKLMSNLNFTGSGTHEDPYKRGNSPPLLTLKTQNGTVIPDNKFFINYNKNDFLFKIRID